MAMKLQKMTTTKELELTKLEQAIKIALEVHSGQVDKAGEMYLLHPLRLMFKFQTEDERVVAVLHDVVEDGEITLENLKLLGFSDSVVNAIDCLSRRKAEKYGNFISRLSINEIARKIKIEDIKDNLDLTRLNHIGEKELKRIEKYHHSLKLLEGVQDSRGRVECH